jgi:hypothetical protein
MPVLDPVLRKDRVMKTYEVIVRSIAYMKRDIEAESLEQARQLAIDAEGDTFSPFDWDWEIYSVEERIEK